MSRRPTRMTPEQKARAHRTEALEALEAVETPTTSQQALRARLRALEAADPVVSTYREVRRLLGIK